MSWRRFCVLYGALGPLSQVCLNYDRIARRAGIRDKTREDSAWRTLTALSRPGS